MKQPTREPFRSLHHRQPCCGIRPTRSLVSVRANSSAVRAAFAGALCLLVTGSAGFCQDTIVAIVNNDVVTQRDLDEYIAFARMQQSVGLSSDQAGQGVGLTKEEALDKLIEDRLILQEARKSSVKVDEGRVKARLADIKKRYGSDVDFQAAMRRQGAVEADITGRIREQFLMHAFVYEKVRSKIAISPSEVTQYYQAHKHEFSEAPRTDIELFIVDQYATAQGIAEALKKGSPLDSFLDDEGVSHQTMSVEEGELRSDIEAIVRDMPAGAVSQPKALEGKYYVFHVTGKTPAREMPLSEAAERVRNVLYDSKVEARLKTYLAQLKSRAYIKSF